MRVTFLGTGDAFSSGGRFNTCFHLQGERASILMDCGTTSLLALKQRGIATDAIDGVVLSHLHGDHFGGLPFLLLDARHMSGRTRPFFVLGPGGTKTRLDAASEALFPGFSAVPLAFPFEIGLLTAGERSERTGFAVTPYPAEHSAGAPCHSLRVEMDGRIVAYSGDTGWTDALCDAARDADLFICECSGYASAGKGHLSFAELAPRLGALGAKRVILTHMNPDMLARLPLGIAAAHDGLSVAL